MNHHSHSHHTPHTTSRALLIGMLLNSLFIVAEIYYGITAHSLALLADAGHNVSDVAGLLIAWIAMILSKRESNSRFTYGLQSASILAALANAVLLLIAVATISYEAIFRLQDPQDMHAPTIMLVATIGVIINGITAWMLHHDQHDLNIKAAFAHMLADAVISGGVVIAAAITWATNWLWLDPAISLIIALVIAYSSWGLFKQALQLSLHAVPTHIDTQKVREKLESLQGVAQVHDLHIWAISTTNIALSAHLVMPNGHPGDQFLYDTTHMLEHEFEIGHATIQIEINNLAHPHHANCDHQ